MATAPVRRRGVKTAPAKAEKAAPAAKRGGVATELSASAERASRVEAQTKEVVKLRNSGQKWGEIGEAVGITPGRAIFLFDAATVGQDEMISFRTDAELSKKLITMRKQGVSWGKLSARTDIGEGKLKKLFVDAGGDLDVHVGRGGRIAATNGNGKPAPAARTRKTKAPAEAPAAKAKVRVRRKSA